MNPADGDVLEAYSSISCACRKRNEKNSECCWIVVIARDLTEGALFDLYQRKEESEESRCGRRKTASLWSRYGKEREWRK